MRTFIHYQSFAFFIAFLLIGAIDTPAAQSQQKPRSANAVLSEAMKTLTDEARKAMIDQRLPRQKADFAKTFNQMLPPELVGRKIVRPTNRDDFVDAYIRWQLTSFNPTLPRMNDREFVRFVSSLPKLLDNPRADEKLLADLNKVIGAGILDEQTQENIRSKISNCIKMSSTATALNLPNKRFRNWILTQLTETGTRPLQVELDHLDKSVRAAWPSDNIKAKLDKLFIKSDRNQSFTIKERQSIVKQAQRLIGNSRVYLLRSNISQGTISADFDDAGVYDFDVRRWARSIIHN